RERLQHLGAVPGHNAPASAALKHILDVPLAAHVPLRTFGVTVTPLAFRGRVLVCAVLRASASRRTVAASSRARSSPSNASDTPMTVSHTSLVPTSLRARWDETWLSSSQPSASVQASSWLLIWLLTSLESPGS